MEEQLVSFKTAKLAKEKGFNFYCNFVYRKNKEYRQVVYFEGSDDNHNEGFTKNSEIEGFLFFDEVFTAPTQSLLQKWLREEHNIHIQVYAYPENYHFSVLKGRGLQTSYDYDNLIVGICGTYEEALEKGLYEALKLIK